MTAASPYDLQRLHATGVVRRIEYHADLTSTNDLALELVKEPSAVLPLLVLADRQTAGRGRGSNRWWAAEGALTFSLALETAVANLPTRHWPQLSLVAGLAICEALQTQAAGAQLQVKWPNDVYLAGRKVCGILIEAPPIPDRLVVGVGVNVNNSFATAPLELQQTATAMCDYDRKSRDLTEVLLGIIARFEQRWAQLADLGFAAIIDDWRGRCLLTGRTIELQLGGDKVLGRCGGIDDEGGLLIHTAGGTQSWRAGSVRLLD